MRDEAAVTVVLAGPDYPERSDHAGAAINGIDAAEAAGALVFHGGTADAGRARSSPTAAASSRSRRPAPTVADARERAYAGGRARVVRRRAVPDATSRRRQVSDAALTLVGILVGSESDRARMQAAIDELDASGDRLGVRGALGAPHARRGRRVRALGGRPRA